MTRIYRSEEGARAVRERYIEVLASWPVAHEELRVPTDSGETFIVAVGDKRAPPLLLLHGSGANSAMWMRDATAWSARFRVYAVDIPGEPGLSAQVRLDLKSEAHALWLDEVMSSLELARAAFVGVSLGGWLALDYAIRRPARVDKLALLCPGGIGRQKFPVKVLALASMGRWGARKARETVLGPMSRTREPLPSAFVALMSEVQAHFRHRREKLPVFDDESLRRISIPVLAIVGGRDVLLDSSDTRRRLELLVRGTEVVHIPDAGHLIVGQTGRVLEFLARQRAA